MTIKREVNLIDENLANNENYFIRRVTVKDTQYLYGLSIPEEIMKLEPKYKNYTIKSILLDLSNKLRTTAGQHPDTQDETFKEVLSSFEPYIISLKRDIREKVAPKSQPQTAEEMFKIYAQLPEEEQKAFIARYKEENK